MGILRLKTIGPSSVPLPFFLTDHARLVMASTGTPCAAREMVKNLRAAAISRLVDTYTGAACSLTPHRVTIIEPVRSVNATTPTGYSGRSGPVFRAEPTSSLSAAHSSTGVVLSAVLSADSPPRVLLGPPHLEGGAVIHLPEVETGVKAKDPRQKS